jgi:diaminopimelate epimerase
MNFTKVQGAGNDFILIEASGTSQNWAQMAVAMCDRHYGIGGDGLLLLLPSGTADFQMRMFNPDGSEAEACGNGLRCFAKYVVDKGFVNTRTDHILVETKAGIREVRLHKTRGRVSTIQVSMGTPQFGANDIPVVIGQGGSGLDITPILDYPLTIDGWELLLSFVSLGNPHAVYFYQHPVSDFPLSQVGPKVEEHKLFPNRVNFEVANVVNRQQIEARVWERGAEETLACGSGACAIAVIAQLQDYIENKVDINLQGGILGVEWDGLGEVFLTGPAEIVFSGEWLSEVKV